MDLIKIRNFEKDHPKEPFPWFRRLVPSETAAIRRRVAQRASLGPDADGLTLVRAVYEASHLVEGANPHAKGFNLGQVFKDLRLQTGRNIFINWYRFDNVDVMQCDDLVRLFDYIYYPSEDIEIFDESMSWMVLIMHFGETRIVRWDA